MSERTIETARQVVQRLSEWYFAEGGDNDPDSPIDREDLDALHDLVRTAEADALDLIRWAESRHAALEPVAGNIMPPGTYACYAGDAGEPYMGPGILGAIRAARRGEGGSNGLE